MKLCKVILKVRHKVTGKHHELTFAVIDETAGDAAKQVLHEYDLSGCEVEHTTTMPMPAKVAGEVYLLESKPLD